jgi:hypothetical protein
MKAQKQNCLVFGLFAVSLLSLGSAARAADAPECASLNGKQICLVTPTCLAEMASADVAAGEVSRLCVGDRAHMALSRNPSVGTIEQVSIAGQVSVRMEGAADAITRNYADLSKSVLKLGEFAAGECVSVASAYGHGYDVATIQELFSDGTALVVTAVLKDHLVEQLFRIRKNPGCSATR